MSDKNQQIIEALQRAYNAELETVTNYLAASINLDGVRAKQIAAALDADINEELTHARQLGSRIKTIGGEVPGSQALKMTQTSLQPPKSSTDVITVIKGVIEAEKAAIEGYKNIIELSDGFDYPTQDLAITLMADEQDHLREFRGFLKEYESGG